MSYLKQVLFLLSALSCLSLQAQVKFRKVIGSSGYDYGMSAQQMFNKGYVAAGSSTSFGSGNTDIYVVMTDSMGNTFDDAVFGGINIDRAHCIRQTADSGFVILGYTNSLGAGGYDVYLLKTDSSLNLQWSKTYGGADWEFGNCIEQTADGGYIICGSTYSYGAGDQDYYLIRTNAAGDTTWTKTYGGSKQDEAKSVIQTSDGGFILTGYTKSMGDTLGDFYTVRTDMNGDTLWTNKFGGPQMDLGNDVLESYTGEFIVGGETKSFGLGNSDGIIVKISFLGASGPTYLVGAAAHDNIQSIAESVDGKLEMAGVTDSYGYANGQGDILYFIINPDYTVHNVTTFGSTAHEDVYSVENTADKGAILCGSTTGFNNLLEDIYLVKADSMGGAGTTESIFITSIQLPESEEEYDFSIYPNPSAGLSYVNIKSNSAWLKITLSDMMGRTLKEELHAGGSSVTSIPLSTAELANGIYLVKVSTELGVHTRRIVVRH